MNRNCFPQNGQVGTSVAEGGPEAAGAVGINAAADGGPEDADGGPVGGPD